MNSGFFKRLCAFLLDYFIVSFILAFITLGFKIDTTKYEEVLSNALNSYSNNEITINEYKDAVSDVNYNIQKLNFPVNVVSVSLSIGYFIVFTYLNKGQTLGKKILKLKLVKEDNNKPKLVDIIIRGLFIYGITSSLFNVIFVNILNKTLFMNIYVIISSIESILLVVSTLMIIYRKDKRSLYDIITKTNVISE